MEPSESVEPLPSSVTAIGTVPFAGSAVSEQEGATFALGQLWGAEISTSSMFHPP